MLSIRILLTNEEIFSILRTDFEAFQSYQKVEAKEDRLGLSFLDIIKPENSFL